MFKSPIVIEQSRPERRGGERRGEMYGYDVLSYRTFNR